MNEQTDGNKDRYTHRVMGTQMDEQTDRLIKNRQTHKQLN